MKKFMKKTLSATSGQSMALVALTILVLALFSFSIVSTGRLIYTRIKMQNAADAAALTAARWQARALNRVAQANIAMNGVVQRLRLFGRDAFFVESSVLSAFRAARSALEAAVRSGSGGFLLWAARDAARSNGAEGVSLGIPPTRLSLQLQAQRGNPWVYKIVHGIPLPWPPFRAGNGVIMYMRTWDQSRLKAQPPHRIRYRAYATAPAPFAASLFRGMRTSRPRIYAMAEAKVWLDVRPDATLHNGGFLRVSERKWWEGIGIQSWWPQFNASLTNITLANGVDNPTMFH